MIINLGDAPFKAFIKVTYKTGTCTCTNGKKTYTHSGGGTATFEVNAKGSWTVKATYGSVSASQSVTISSRNETKSVTLVYKLDLYNAGNQCTSVTGGWVTKGDANLEASKMNAWSSWQTSGFTTNNTLSFTGFSKICVTFGYYESTTRIKIVDSTDIHATAKATQYANATTTTMAIGAITSGKVQICMNANQGFTVTKVWLES